MKVKLTDITLPEGLRPLNWKKIEGIAASLHLTGKMYHPITVDQDHTLIDGQHRYHAAKLCSWDTVPVDIVRRDSLAAQIAEFATLALRNNGTALDRAVATKKFLDFLEEHGQEKAADTVAQVTERSRRTVFVDAAIARDLTEDVQALVQGTEIADQQTELMELSRVAPAVQMPLANRLVTLAGMGRTSRDRRDYIEAYNNAPRDDIREAILRWGWHDTAFIQELCRHPAAETTGEICLSNALQFEDQDPIPADQASADDLRRLFTERAAAHAALGVLEAMADVDAEAAYRVSQRRHQPTIQHVPRTIGAFDYVQPHSVDMLMMQVEFGEEPIPAVLPRWINYFDEAWRVLTERGSLYLFVEPPYDCHIAVAATEVGFLVNPSLYWNRRKNKRARWGEELSVIVHLSKKLLPYHNMVDNLAVVLPYTRDEEGNIPMALYEYLMKTSTPQKALIMDTHCGVGNSIVTAMMNARYIAAFDTSKEQINAARARLELEPA